MVAVIPPYSESSLTYCSIATDFFSENDCARRLLVLMEYRGKHYTIVQGIDRNSWKWKVHLDERTVRSGESPTSEAARHSVVWAVDKALAPKMVKLQPQGDRVS